MLRGLFRILSLVSLALALVSGVLDMTRSIADSQIIFTPLYVDWIRLSPGTLTEFGESVSNYTHPWVWDPAIITLLKAPTWTVFALLAVLLGMASRRKRKRWQENFGA
ncbi:MAG: hypothetical protein ACR2O0_00850 [Rhizobiaceae bacterium]|uniref:Uncharacterized protein n=1 Tax=marine sediment metagenome TaxID=412755 RepID=X1UDY6_9ZZZZ